MTDSATHTTALRGAVPDAASGGLQPRRLFRATELIIIAYFIISALRVAGDASTVHRLIDVSVIIVLAMVAAADRVISRRWMSMMRDWTPLAFFLVAYWNVDWVASSSRPDWFFAHEGLRFDHWILQSCGLARAIEAIPLLDPLLELCYMLLYAAPPLALGLLYVRGKRADTDRFLSTLFTGALAAYALLPMFPSVSPRIAFPREGPEITNALRALNVSLLDSCDIRASVFPSGHVAVAFSLAFAVLRVFRRQPRVWAPFFVFAMLVATDTVYARYHYAVDAIAGFAIGVAAAGAGRLQDAVRQNSGRWLHLSDQPSAIGVADS